MKSVNGGRVKANLRLKLHFNSIYLTPITHLRVFNLIGQNRSLDDASAVKSNQVSTPIRIFLLTMKRTYGETLVFLPLPLAQ
ncbi:hypothetical protein TNCV_3653361 [Trichonephila clavipes]|nr:hypothetical protein TNCV_3653361 [Trichonephila clavipes]